MTDWMKDYGARLRDNGYSIIPIKPNSKAPGRFANGQWVNLSGWNQFADKPAQPFVISTWSRMPGCGIGVMCGKTGAHEYGLVGMDIDVLDVEVSTACIEVFERRLGPTPAVRIGLSPKAMLLYRTAETLGKITMAPLECLGQGQQFVAYGIHEKTGEPYKWPIESLVDIPMDSLPVVTGEQLWAAMDEAYALIPAHMRSTRLAAAPARATGEVISFPGAHQANDELRGTPEACAEMIARIPNDDLAYEDWNRVGMAMFGASSGEAWGFDLFQQFSRKSRKCGATKSETPAARWSAYHKSPPSRIGFGTLQHIAFEHDSSPIPADIAFNDDKKAAAEFDISSLLAEKLPPPPPPRAEAPPAKYLQLTQQQIDSFPREWLETPSLVGQVTRWIVSQSMFEHPTLALGNALSMMGALFGRRYRANGDSRLNTTANMFAVGIAPSSAGKDHSRKMVLKLMRAAGLSQYSGGEDFTSGPALLTMMEMFPSRLCMVDEFGMFLASVRDPKSTSHRKGVMTMFLKMFSSAGGAMLGQEYANQTEKARIDIEAPNFNFYGTTTPETLVAALDRTLVTDGTLNRMLWFPPFNPFPYAKIMKPERQLSIPEDLIAAIKHAASVMPVGAGNLTSLQQANVAPETIDVTFDMGVEDNIQAISDRETELKREGRLEWGRFCEYTIKLAMIEAIALDPVNPVITEDILAMAYRLAEWCFSYLESIVKDDVAENEFEKRRNMVRKFIAAADQGATLKAISKKFTGLKSKDRQEILQALEEAGEIVCEKFQNPNGGPTGRLYKSTRAA